VFHPHSVVLIISKYTRGGEHEEPVLLVVMTALSPETGRLRKIALGMERHRILESLPLWNQNKHPHSVSGPVTVGTAGSPAREIDSAAAFLHRLTQKYNIADTVFLVEAGGYLTVLARHELSGLLEYQTRNHIKMALNCDHANRPLSLLLEGQSIQRKIVVTTLQTPLQSRTTQLNTRRQNAG